MATIETVYHGDMRTEATHTQSGSKIETDAPTDNNGKGERFSPTDMVASALTSCMMTLMAQAAERNGIDLKGMRAETNKIMESNPRRIGEIVINFYMPDSYDEKIRTILERAAHTCPVGRSLHPDLKQTITFIYK